MRNFVPKDKGFTLTEALIAMTILSIVAAGIVLPFSAAAAVQTEAARRTAAAKLASDLMEEILSSPYSQIISTYNGYTETMGTVKNYKKLGFTSSFYSKYSRTATCQAATVGGVGVILVTVRVSYNGIETAKLAALVSR